MSIGIEDADFNQYTLVCFNLEAMKLSAYYKSHNELVVLAPGFFPERHTKFFYRKDYNDGSFPPGLLTTPNVQYGGLAFTQNKYYPLPLDIEVCHPDSSLYTRVEKDIMNLKVENRKKIFQNLMEAEHCRISLDGRTIWPDFEKQFKNLPTCRNLILHDFDLGQVENSFDTIKYILSNARTDGWATKIGMKFPIQIYDGEELLKWASLNSNSIFYSVQYNGVIPNEAFMEWIGRNRQHAIYTQMDYVVTAPQYTEEQFTTSLINDLYHQILIARSFRLFFKIKYEETFFKDKMWCEVLRLFNFYMMSMTSFSTDKYLQRSYDDTMYDFVKKVAHDEPLIKYTDYMTRQQVREVFRFVGEHNLSLFEDFYQCNARSLGGKI